MIAADAVVEELCVGSVLRQRGTRLTGNEPAMGCDAGPTLNRNLVGRPTSSVEGKSWASIE